MLSFTVTIVNFSNGTNYQTKTFFSIPFRSKLDSSVHFIYRSSTPLFGMALGHDRKAALKDVILAHINKTREDH